MDNAHAADDRINDALAELMQLIGIDAPPDGVTPELIQQANLKLKSMMEQYESKGDSNEGQISTSNVTKLTPFRSDKHKNVLITGQLGIIVHQLRQAITKLGGEVTIAKDMDEAISEYQKRDYSLVIIDLFMPTEREGLIVLEEIKRISVVCHINTHVMVLAPQTKDKGIKDRCKTKGATFFLEKMEGWHKVILQYYLGEIPADQFEIA